MDETKDDEQIKEVLLIKSMGYLRLPKRVRDNYGNPKDYPNPDGFVQASDGKLSVTFVFDIDQLPKDKGSDIDDKKKCDKG